MGDVADAILDGDLCQCCGVYMPNSAGVPQTCDACLRDSERPRAKTTKVKCGVCQKLVKETGLQDHMRAKHPGT